MIFSFYNMDNTRLSNLFNMALSRMTNISGSLLKFNNGFNLFPDNFDFSSISIYKVIG